jgi:23S rRNA pseudouridine1911/1915/1917 synthase
VREFPRQALHATQLGLVHPVTGEDMVWQVDPPADFADLLICLESAELL